MEKSKALFGEAESIMEQTRKPRLIEQQIKRNEIKAKKQQAKSKRKLNTHSKKPNSFSK